MALDDDEETVRIDDPHGLYRREEAAVPTRMVPTYEGYEEPEVTEVTPFAELMATQNPPPPDVFNKPEARRSAGPPPRKFIFTGAEWRLLLGVVIASAIGTTIPLLIYLFW